MGAVSFLFSFLVVAIIGGETATRSFETILSERIGAAGLFYFLGLWASIISTLCYAISCQRFRRTTWYTGLLGGTVAAGTFCASVLGGYTVLGDFALVPILVLPVVTGVLWPFLSADARGTNVADRKSAPVSQKRHSP
jgi:hypothetical protein